MSTDNGGWKKNIPSWDWYPLVFAKWPDWEKEGDFPPFVELIITKGKGKSSHEMAVEFDDIAQGNFYWRDWTDSGLPFVDKGESYKSCFWFEFVFDRDIFKQKFGV
jgi:hypothetical protein